MEEKKNKINVIVPFYNCKQFLERCVASVMTQKYDNYHVYFVDDASTDGSGEIIDNIPDKSKFTLIRNETNLSALPNIINTVLNFCEPDSISSLLDGDDWFSGSYTLSKVNTIFNKSDCIFQYGQSMWTDSRRGFASAYTKDQFEKARQMPFKVSHLRSFRSFIIGDIKNQDPNLSCMKNSSGSFHRFAYDCCLVFPIFDLISHEKLYFCDDILYIYNRENVLSEDRIDQQKQWDVHKEVANKPPLKRIY